MVKKTRPTKQVTIFFTKVNNLKNQGLTRVPDSLENEMVTHFEHAEFQPPMRKYFKY